MVETVQKFKNKLKDVKAIYATTLAFAALTYTGSVVTWGNADQGGNSELNSPNKDSIDISNKLASDVETIYTTRQFFIALKTDGTVITWGNTGCY